MSKVPSKGRANAGRTANPGTSRKPGQKKKTIAFDFPPMSMPVQKKAGINFEELKKKTIRRNAPKGEDKQGILKILKSLKQQKISVQEYVTLIAPFTGDNGAELRAVLEEDMIAFRKLVRKIYDTMTQDVSDVLVNEQIQLSSYYDERQNMLNEKLMRIINDIYQMIPEFNFEEYYKNKEEYLNRILPIPAVIERGEEDIEMQRRQEAFHRIQWLKFEGDRLADENKRLQSKLEQLKRDQKAEQMMANQIQDATEARKQELEAEQAVKQQELDNLSESIEKGFVRSEKAVRLQKDKEARASGKAQRAKSKGSIAIKKKKRPEWVSTTAADMEQEAIEERLVAEQQEAGAIRRQMARRARSPHFSPIKTPPPCQPCQPSIAPQFEEVLFSCKWLLQNETCSNFFTPMLTEDGMCFTFNMLDRSELLRNNVYLHGDYMNHGRTSEGWTLENGYPKSSPIHTFPRRAISSGSSAGLFLLLRAYEPDLDYVCRGPVQGFKVLLHHPAEVPRVGKQYFRAPLNQEVIVSVKPDMMTTSEGLKDYDPHRRQCFFPKERHLAFFQSYTQQNCQVECLTNYTLQKCGCVSYHMPHEEGTAICGSGSISCLFEAQSELLEKEVQSGISSFENQDEYNHQSANCDCLPACTSLVYNAETSQADFNWPKLFQAFRVNFSEFPGVQFTRLTIFFKEQQFITSERNELYGQTDFLANCGGILGLFTGFSFLSIVEIFYFLTLRLICNVKKYGPHYWSGSKDLINNDAYVHKK